MAQTIKLRRSSTSGAVPTTSSLSLGEVAINTYDGKMYIKKNDGTDAIVELSGDKLPLSGGTLTGNLSLGDNDKAQFGAGNDLEIYSDGTNGFINENGSGHLYIQATNLRFKSRAGENFMALNENGAVTAYYDNVVKLATTSSGIDVTGTVTSTGLTTSGTLTQFSTYNSASTLLGINIVSDAGSTSYTHPYLDFRRWTGTGTNHYTASIEVAPTNANANAIVFMSDTKSTNTKATTERMRIDSSGNLRVGAGNTFEPVLQFTGSGRAQANPGFTFNNDLDTGMFNPSTQNTIAFATGGTEKMRITSPGNVGIGTTSPIAPLHVAGNAIIETGSPDLYFATTSANHTNWRLAAQETVSQAFEIASGTESAGSNAVNDTYTTRFVVKSSGNVGIGTNDPNFMLHINKGTSSYAPTDGVNENIFGLNTSYNSTGTQGVTFSNLEGNWIDGTSGSDSAYGWLWSYENSVRGGLVYDHRGSERMQLFSSYGALAFITPNAADGNGVPTDSNMVERLTILPGGNVGIGNLSPGATLHVDPTANVTTGFGTPLIKVGGDNSWAGNGSIYSVGFGYVDNSISNKSPAEIGFLTITNAGYTKGDLVFATRDVTTNTAPLQRMRITSDGNVNIVNEAAAPTNSYSLPGALIFKGKGWDSNSGSNDMQSKIELKAAYGDHGNGATQGSLVFSLQGAGGLDSSSEALIEGMRLTAGGAYNHNHPRLSVGSDYPQAGMHVANGGILLNGTINNSMSSYHGSNIWTYIYTCGTSGTFNGALRVNVPDCDNSAANVGYGGFSMEVYVSGYQGQYCHAFLSGYTNTGITLSESAIRASNGGWSVSYGTVGVQGFYFDLNYPSGLIHPSAYIRITKGGDPNSGRPTNMAALSTVWT